MELNSGSQTEEYDISIGRSNNHLSPCVIIFLNMYAFQFSVNMGIWQKLFVNGPFHYVYRPNAGERYDIMED